MSSGRLRARLSEATRAAHERLHGHSGFSAAAAGRLDARAYRDLLARLYGFHQPFEAEFAKAPPDMARAIELGSRRRSQALVQDLRSLGFAADETELPLCRALPNCICEPEWLGALYVTEGSTLGGAPIARALEQAGFTTAQRRFFEAYGERRGAMWRTLLARLESHADDPGAAKKVERSAQALFEAFEVWMRDWDGAAGAY